MRRLFILRPEPGASGTVRDASTVGLDAVAMPLFAIQPLEWDEADPTAFDGLLLTSANAVRCGGENLGRLRDLRVHAVGQATATAARDAGFTIATVGRSGVEPLLGEIDPNLNLLHLCGEHRMPVEAPQRITTVPVYRSAAVPTPAGFRQIEGQTVAVHSRRAAERLAELADQEGIARSTTRLIAISETVRSAAGEGWEKSEAAPNPGNNALLALAARLCDITEQK